MPQLDRLLSVMVSNRAEALRLVENELASLVKDGTAVPLTKQPLGASQLLGLLREIAPPDAMRRLDDNGVWELFGPQLHHVWGVAGDSLWGADFGGTIMRHPLPLRVQSPQ